MKKKQNTSLKLTSFEKLENKHYGKRGSLKREAYETAFKEELIGELKAKSYPGRTGCFDEYK
jgi:hypothetical protein